MRRPATEPTLSIYWSHDRELLFHGTHAECVEHNISVRKDLSSLSFDGKRYPIVNQDLHVDRIGSAAFWVIRPQKPRAR